jgi:hypothetical protein
VVATCGLAYHPAWWPERIGLGDIEIVAGEDAHPSTAFHHVAQLFEQQHDAGSAQERHRDVHLRGRGEVGWSRARREESAE